MATVNLTGQLDTNDVVFEAPIGFIRRADEYDLGVTSGGPATVEIKLSTQDNNYDPYLEVIDKNTNEIVGFNDNSLHLGGLNSKIDGLIVLPSDNYKIRVTHSPNLTPPPPSGSYSYDLEVIAPGNDINVNPRERNFNNQIGTGQSVVANGTLDKEDYTFPAPVPAPPPIGGNTLVDEYQLEVSNSQNVTVDLTSNDSGFDPYLQIVDAETGREIASDDDSGGGTDALINNASLNAGTEYRIHVITWDGNQSSSIGNYRLSVSGNSGNNLTLTARSVDINRYWDFQAQSHVFTQDDVDELTGGPYRPEGIEFRTPPGPEPDVLPVYQYVNPNTGTKFYSFVEPDFITNNFNLNEEEIAFYAYKTPQQGGSPPTNAIPVYRFFNQGASQPGSPVHFYTASESNKNTVVALPGFNLEGPAWYAFPGP